MKIRIWTLLVLFALTPTATHAQSTDIADSDFDGSGRVEFLDFLDFAGAFGKSSGQDGFDSKFDLDGSTVVDFPDFLIFASNFGKSTTAVETTYLYVADFFGNRVEVIDTATNLAISSRAFITALPRGLAVGAQTGLIYVSTLDSLKAYSENGAFSFGIPLTSVENPVTGDPSPPGGFKVTVNNAETLAFVSEDAPGAVEVIDLVQRVSAEQILVGAFPTTMVLSADESELYVGHNAAKVSVLNVSQRALVDSISIARAANGRIAATSDASTLYIATTHLDADHTSGALVQIQSIDVATRSVIDSVRISNLPDFSGQVVDLKVSPTGGSLLVSYSRTAPNVIDELSVFTFVGELIIINLVDLTVSQRITIGESAAGFGVSPDGATAYVSGSEDLLNQVFRVFVVDVLTGTRLSQLPIVIQSASEFLFQAAKQAQSALISQFQVSFGF
jgi:DNA-binding beta-propeller fold protein YncE